MLCLSPTLTLILVQHRQPTIPGIPGFSRDAEQTMHSKPSFLITIDTEGDNLWAKPQKVTTRNAAHLPRFQELCQKYNLKPTYLTNFEMANSPAFQELAKDVLQRAVGEIGMHLHAWDMPPLFQLTEDDWQFCPYLIEYPERIMRDKIRLITDFLEDVLGTKMLSHRAGRWSFNETYARILIENGYRVDCSVTPHVSWKNTLGDPTRNGGTDYTEFPENAYFIDPFDISHPGGSALLEVPVTIAKSPGRSIETLRATFRKVPPVRKALNYFFPPLTWLRPNGCNLKYILKLLRNAVRIEKDYVEFMLHSSELMPGGSPTFMSDKSIENLYEDLETLFAEARMNFTGCTLAEYYRKYVGSTNEKNAQRNK